MKATSQRAEEILTYWLGKAEESAFPASDRVRIWLEENEAADNEMRSLFAGDLEKAMLGHYNNWEDSPRSMLALIILFDQFSRHIYRNTPLAFAQDRQALDLCLRGIEKQYDHSISLLERAFFYFPLMHSENIDIQATSIRAYKILLDLSFPEARSVFESLLNYALKSFDVIKRFGRFPHRNKVLGRIPTAEELKYLEKEYPRGRE